MALTFFKLLPCSHSSPSFPPRLTRFSDSIMEVKVETAASVIAKSDSETSFLFGHGRSEAGLYLNSVKDLHAAMQYFVAEDPKSEVLVRAHNLMQSAMKRLEKEFRLILSSDFQLFGSESPSSQSSSARSSNASVSSYGDESEDGVKFDELKSSFVSKTEIVSLADLKDIAECMIASGYGKECIRVFKSVRKSILDEEMLRIGMEKQPITSSQMKKMDWDAMDLKVKNWLNTIKIAVKSLFYRERILCEQIFSTSLAIAESCFAEITRDSAISLFEFVGKVSKLKKSPERLFGILDMYEAIASLWPEIDSIFSYDSTSSVRSHAVGSLIKLGAAVRSILSEFESVMQKDASKTAAPGGGVHPLTRSVMNYLVSLGNYSGILADIFADWPLHLRSPLPESYFNAAELEGRPYAAVSATFAWLVLILLCKLDVKAEFYRGDVALSYLFLANNLQYIVVRVRESNLRNLLGDDWISKHESKVEQYATSYERIGWGHVVSSLHGETTAAVDSLKRFHAVFKEANRKQDTWVVPDPNLRDRIRGSLEKKIGSVYRDFYGKYRWKFGREFTRFAPQDLNNYMSNLFNGSCSSGSTTSLYSSGSSSDSSHVLSFVGTRGINELSYS